MLSLLLAAFFAFVGYMKAFAPPELLARHDAWTVHIAESVGRLVGWSEMAGALVLVAAHLRIRWSRAGLIAAGVLILNQIGATSVHLLHGEIFALPQNAVIVAISLIVLLLHARRMRPGTL